MTEEELKKIADKADMIIRGYAFTRNEEGFIQILNLRFPDSAMVITSDGTMVATNMDDIEQVLVLDIWKKNAKYMEEAGA
jgi:hypothetical protein